MLRLRISNFDALSGGGSLDYEAKERSFEIGRASYLDWPLPDEERIVSSVHCRVDFAAGSYDLVDVSSNGTFINGSTDRVRSPHRLRNGDRIEIGPYHIEVEIDAPAEYLSDARRAVVRQVPSSAYADGGLIEPAVEEHYLPYGAYEEVNGEGTASEGFWMLDDAAPPMDRNAFGPAETPHPAGAVDVFVEMPRLVQLSPKLPRRPEPVALSGEFPSFSVVGSEGFAPSPLARPAPGNHAETGAKARVGAEVPTMGGADVRAMMEAFAAGAGIPVSALAGRDPNAFAREAGALLRLCIEQTAGLLRTRRQAKSMLKSASHTMIGSDRNNPLKFVPEGQVVEEMLGLPRRGYLSATEAMREGFRDVAGHEAATYSAMQSALAKLLDDLSPEAIEARATGFALARKARSWDTFVTVWDAKVGKGDNGLLDLFLSYFGEFYDEAVSSVQNAKRI